ARKMFFVLGLGHGERVDVVAAAGKEADHARQHTRLVIDNDRKRAMNDLLLHRLRGIVRRRTRLLAHTITFPSSVIASSKLSAASPKIISLCARPDGIIGKQFSVLSTTQSNRTGFFTLIISLIAPSRSPGFSQRMPTP